MRRVPVIALHAGRVLGDHAAADARFRGGESRFETEAVGEHEIGVVGGDGRAFGVGDAPVHRERRRLGAPRDLDRLFHREAPGMEEVEVRKRSAKQARRIGKPGGGVLRRVARDRARRFHAALDRFRRKVGGARVAAAPAEIDGDRETLVAVVLDGVHLAAAHGHRLADRGGHFDLGVARALRARDRERGARRLPHGVTRERQCGDRVVWHRLHSGKFPGGRPKRPRLAGRRWKNAILSARRAASARCGTSRMWARRW